MNDGLAGTREPSTLNTDTLLPHLQYTLSLKRTPSPNSPHPLHDHMLFLQNTHSAA